MRHASYQSSVWERETDMQRKTISKALGAALGTVGTEEHSHFYLNQWREEGKSEGEWEVLHLKENWPLIRI